MAGQSVLLQRSAGCSAVAPQTPTRQQQISYNRIYTQSASVILNELLPKPFRTKFMWVDRFCEDVQFAQVWTTVTADNVMVRWGALPSEVAVTLWAIERNKHLPRPNFQAPVQRNDARETLQLFTCYAWHSSSKLYPNRQPKKPYLLDCFKPDGALQTSRVEQSINVSAFRSFQSLQTGSPPVNGLLETVSCLFPSSSLRQAGSCFDNVMVWVWRRDFYAMLPS